MLAFFQKLLENPVFNGIMGGSLVGVLFYLFRWIPQTLYEWTLWRFTTNLTVYNEDAAFDRVSEWLAGLEYTKRARRLRLSSSIEAGSSEEVTYFTPGIGKHLLWYKGRPLLIERYLPKESPGGGSSFKRREDIVLSTLGSSSKLMHELIHEIILARTLAREKTITVYLYKNYWRLVARKIKRPLESIFLPAGQAERLIKDLEWFLRSQEWYAERGIPYRRGILLEGPPGCGKTSLVMALAGHLSKPIYVLNLGSLVNDNDLIEAVTSVPEHGIFLIEDIDAAVASAARSVREETKSVHSSGFPSNGDPQAEIHCITLSGLLNAIDGTFSRDGRILIMTTNHPEKIDPALIRKGRADVREHIGLLGAPEVLAMCRHFLGDSDGATMAETVTVPIAPADLQELLLQKVA